MALTACSNIGHGPLDGNFSLAYAINNAGQILGDAATADGESRAFLYTAEEGMIDLNTLIDLPSGWVIEDAHGINDAGWIAATGYNADEDLSRAFLLTPVPEPGTWALLILGSGMTLLFRRKRHRAADRRQSSNP
jgi:probable HAF family extracellular repeat protein